MQPTRPADRRPGALPGTRAGHYSGPVPHTVGGDERFRGDSGAADAAVSAALAAYADGTGSEHAVLVALAESRLLVPVVAVRADELAGSGSAELKTAGEKAAEMATPVIIGRDGRTALPAFTSVDAVSRWQPGARPVPVPASGVWQSAMQEASAVVIDIAGPVPLAVEGTRLATLAAGGPPPALHEDPDAWEQVAAAAADVAPGIRVRLSEPHGDVDFTLELAPPAGAAKPVPDEMASLIADAVVRSLAGRVRLGIVTLVRPPG